jgi:DNA-binding beta-propeller fold protein YncE
VGTVRAGVSPAVVAIDPANNTVYVGDTYDATDQFPPSGAGASAHEGTVSVVDGATRDARDPSGCASQTPPLVTVGRDPIGLFVDASNPSIYVANALDDTLSVIDATSCNGTRRAGCDDRPPTIAVGGASDALVDAAQHTVYVVDSADNGILVLSDLSCGAETSSTCRRPVDAVPAGKTPSAAATDERFQTIYVGDTNGFQPPYTVSMINAAACNVYEQSGCTHSPPAVRAAWRPFNIAVNQRTNTVYVASSDPLQVIDTTHCHAGDTSGCASQTPQTVNLPNANGPIGIAVDPTTHTAHATEGFPFTPGAVALIDTSHCHAGDTSQCSTQTPTTIPVPPGPVRVQIDLTTDGAYLGDLYDSSVSVIDGRRCNASDISGCGRIRKFEVGSNPSAITFDRHNHTVYVPNFHDNDASVFGTLGSFGS